VKAGGEGARLGMRRFEQFGGRTEQDHLAILEQTDAAAEDKRFGDIVGDEHHGLAQVLLQGFELLLNAAPGDRIEGAKGQMGKGKGLFGRMAGMAGMGGPGAGGGMPAMDPAALERLARSGGLPGGLPGVLPGGGLPGLPGIGGPKLPGLGGGLPGLPKKK
jgi:hypothetical protein